MCPYPPHGESSLAGLSRGVESVGAYLWHMADARMLVAFKLLEAVGVPGGMKGPSADPVGTQGGTGCFLHLLSAEVEARGQRGDKEHAVPPPRGHCFRTPERCSELWDVFLGHQAGNLFFVFWFFLKNIFPECPRFYKCQLSQNILQDTKGRGGGLIPSTPTLPVTGLTPGFTRTPPERLECASSPAPEAQPSAWEVNILRKPQQRAT